MEEHKEGRNLLERCDKLFHSIAEITATELQPSPVSELDSSFYKDKSSSSPSPVMKQSIDFKGARVVISHPQGRQVLEQQRKQYPDMVISDLPDETSLKIVATDRSFEMVEFVALLLS